MARPRSEHPKAQKGYMLPGELVAEYAAVADRIGLTANVLVERAMAESLPLFRKVAEELYAADQSRHRIAR